MAEILRRAVSYVTNKELQLKSAHNLKFLKMVEPAVNPALLLQFSMTEDADDYKVKATLGTQDETFFKEQAIFQSA